MSKEQSKDSLWALRHSAEHVLHTAMQNLYPKLKKAMGPATDEGFYHDFDLDKSISTDNFPKIEAEMQKLIDADLPITQEEITIEKAKKIFKDNPYKLEWISEIENKNEKVTIFKMGDTDLDLCSGPHAKSTGEIKAFKLTKVAGAYWRGDEKNKMLQRVYGTAFPKQSQLKKYLELLEEAQKRDHKKLGKELDLFSIDPTVGLGLPLWHPKGTTIWQSIQDYWHSEHYQRGYELVRTPHIGSQKLWETSGHWNFFRENMYSPISIEDENYLIKPMNCPFHVSIYNANPKSYRDLPIRWAECGTVYRYEKSGTLSGLTRVRGFTQDDAHIICTKKQVEDELKKTIKLIQDIWSTFGFTEYTTYLSLRDPDNKEKYAGNDEGWDFTEKILRKVAKDSNLKAIEEKGEAAFYGPKLDFKTKDSLGREWQCSTLQFDFNLPDRFKMEFTNEKGKKEQPYMLHRALLGSFERFIGILIEHYAGAFPLWLSPIQIVLISVSEKHKDHCHKLKQKLLEQNLRVEVWDDDETVGNKIRKAINQKIPYMLVIGDKEIDSPNLHVRKRGSRDVEEIEKDKFIKQIQTIISDKSQEL